MLSIFNIEKLMSFHERSAWLMIVALVITGSLFYAAVFAISGESEFVPKLPLFIGFTIALTVISTIGHIIIAVNRPKEAITEVDEREKRVFEKAGHHSGSVLGAAVVMSMLVFLFLGSGNLLFYLVFSSLLIAQIVEYALQIVYSRRMMF